MVNERSKARMLEQKKLIVDSLKNQFTFPLFEDEIAEDEEQAFIQSKKYYAAVLRMGNFTPSSNSTLIQSIMIDYYSENRDDVDETLIDIISLVVKVPTVEFVKTNKMRLRAGDTDRFVDVTTIEFRRLVKYDGGV